MDTKTILISGALVAAGAIAAPALIPTASAYEPDSALCAKIVAAYGGTCEQHLDGALKRMAARAEQAQIAKFAADAALLDAKDLEALKAKADLKRAALEAVK